MKKVISLILSLLIFNSLVSCDAFQTTTNFVEIANLQEYVIVYSNQADVQVISSIMTLRNTFINKYGIKLTSITDSNESGEKSPVILIGSTNRSESNKNLKYYDYAIEFVNDNIIINAGSNEALVSAVDWIIENCCGETFRIPEKYQSVGGEYPLADVTINGVKLNEYAFPSEEDITKQELYDEMSRWIAKNTGYYPASTSEHCIILEENLEVCADSISLTNKDSNLVLEVPLDGYSKMEDVVQHFYEMIENRKSNDITMNETIKIPNEKFLVATEEQLSDWQTQANILRKEILNTPNMEIPAGSTVYYLSARGDDENDGKSPKTAWKTIARLSEEDIKPGSYVCFKRGDVFRGTFAAKEGVTYTAYGEGEKPKIYASPFNCAENGQWEEVAPNIWRYSIAFKEDVGAIFMNAGEEHGLKIILDYTADGAIESVARTKWKDYTSLDEELEFWHDLNGPNRINNLGGYVYLYCSKGNPSEVWNQIEFNPRVNIISIIGINNVTLDNLCLMYTGAHAVSIGDAKNVTISNCEVGFIGGSIQFYSNGKPTRYGNGIQVYGACEGYYIDHCWVYECYDAGITHQYSKGGTDDCVEKDVYYTNNLLERNVYNIEYFMGRGEVGTEIRYHENIVIKNNILLDAGYGWGKQRPGKDAVAHIKGWDSANALRGDFIIENNIMLRSTYMMVHISASKEEHLPTYFNNNIIAQNRGGDWGRYSITPTTLLPFTYDNLNNEKLSKNTYYVVPFDSNN